MAKLRIDVWSDVACPWCYVGKRRLDTALEQFPQREAVEVVWRSFELNPSAPRRSDESGSHAERLARKYGMSVAAAQSRIEHLTSLARAEGLTLDFDRLRPGNTFDAHRLLHLAAERGVQGAVKERFFRGYFSEGQAIGDAATLSRLAVEAGLDGEEVAATLASSLYGDRVRADEAEAARLGIHGVPFFVFAGRYAVSGAQPAELLARALRQAYEEAAPAAAEPAGGAARGPDGC